jgi:hypothetical protein
MLMEAIAGQILATDKNFPEVSIIMPCLNEADILLRASASQKSTKWTKIAGEINRWES